MERNNSLNFLQGNTTKRKKKYRIAFQLRKKNIGTIKKRKRFSNLPFVFKTTNLVEEVEIEVEVEVEAEV